jgi:hypothetical protein
MVGIYFNYGGRPQETAEVLWRTTHRLLEFKTALRQIFRR